jgi:hypothetical protein
MNDDNNDTRTELLLDSFTHAEILNLLGGELSYNELVRFSHDMEETAKFEITQIEFQDYILVQVRINGNLMLDKKYYNGVNNEFIYLLEGVMDEYKEQEDEDKEEPDEEEEIRVKKKVINGITYLMSYDKVLYDLEEHNRIGIWNEETQTIEKDEDEEEDEDDEEEEEDETQVEDEEEEEVMEYELSDIIASCDKRISFNQDIIDKIEYLQFNPLSLALGVSTDEQTEWVNKKKMREYAVKLIKIEKLIYTAIQKKSDKTIFSKYIEKYDELLNMSYDLSGNLVSNNSMNEGEYLEFCNETMKQRNFLKDLCEIGERDY